jgi:hypothetical protein
MGHNMQDPSPEDLARQVNDLQDVFSRYGAHRFAPGDLVTPSRTSPLRYKGRPFVVLETQNQSDPDFASCPPGDNDYGIRPDIRVAGYSGDEITVWWAESFWFVPFR